MDEYFITMIYLGRMMGQKSALVVNSLSFASFMTPDFWYSPTRF